MEERVEEEEGWRKGWIGWRRGQGWRWWWGSGRVEMGETERVEVMEERVEVMEVMEERVEVMEERVEGMEERVEVMEERVEDHTLRQSHQSCMTHAGG